MPNHREAKAPRHARNPDNDVSIVDLVEKNPEIGIRGIASRLRLPYRTVQHTLKAENFHAYHYTKVQHFI